MHSILTLLEKGLYPLKEHGSSSEPTLVLLGMEGELYWWSFMVGKGLYSYLTSCS